MTCQGAENRCGCGIGPGVWLAQETGMGLGPEKIVEIYPQYYINSELFYRLFLTIV
jgi:hypothetical protein